MALTWGSARGQGWLSFRAAKSSGNKSIAAPCVLWCIGGRGWLEQYRMRATTVGRIYPTLQPSWVCALGKSSWPSSHRGSLVPVFPGLQQTRFLLVSLMFAATGINGFLKFSKDFTCPQS